MDLPLTKDKFLESHLTFEHNQRIQVNQKTSTGIPFHNFFNILGFSVPCKFPEVTLKMITNTNVLMLHESTYVSYSRPE